MIKDGITINKLNKKSIPVEIEEAAYIDGAVLQKQFINGIAAGAVKG